MVVEWSAKRRNGVVELADIGCIWRLRYRSEVYLKMLEMAVVQNKNDVHRKRASMSMSMSMSRSGYY